MLRDFISYVKDPREGGKFDFKPKTFLNSLWLAAIVLFITLGLGLLMYVLGKMFPQLASPRLIEDDGLQWWKVALFGPVVEELMFRLPLRRRKPFLAINFVIVVFVIVSSFFFAKSTLSTEHLLLRSAIALGGGALLYAVLAKKLIACRYKPYFWFWAISFGCMHIGNIDMARLLPLDIVSTILYALTRVLFGLAMGYVRNRQSIFTSTALHILNNLITVI